MTKEEMAKALDGMEYREGVPKDLIWKAKLGGLVIVTGYSDDIIDFEGAIQDQTYVGEDSEVIFDEKGFIPEWDDCDKDTIEQAKKYINRIESPNNRTITAIWDKEGYSWIYETDIPHAVFDVVEDGEKYCRGIVFYLY